MHSAPSMPWSHYIYLLLLVRWSYHYNIMYNAVWTACKVTILQVDKLLLVNRHTTVRMQTWLYSYIRNYKLASLKCSVLLLWRRQPLLVKWVMLEIMCNWVTTTYICSSTVLKTPIDIYTYRHAKRYLYNWQFIWIVTVLKVYHQMAHQTTWVQIYTTNCDSC